MRTMATGTTTGMSASRAFRPASALRRELGDLRAQLLRLCPQPGSFLPHGGLGRELGLQGFHPRPQPRSFLGRLRRPRRENALEVLRAEDLLRVELLEEHF